MKPDTNLNTFHPSLLKAFQGQHGKAYLFHKVVNITEGTVEDRSMTTGLHTVADVSCLTCGSTVGWKYVREREGEV